MAVESNRRAAFQNESIFVARWRPSKGRSIAGSMIGSRFISSPSGAQCAHRGAIAVLFIRLQAARSPPGPGKVGDQKIQPKLSGNRPPSTQVKLQKKGKNANETTN